LVHANYLRLHVSALIMTNYPFVSIIIPTRNEEKTISATIAQYEPFLAKYNLEIIISDANSTDNTVQEVEYWLQKYGSRIKLVQPQGKQNIAIGRNAGASIATGFVLFHTDADVRLPQPDLFFKSLIRLFAQPKWVAATTPIRIYPEEATVTDRVYHWLMNTTIRASIPLRCSIAKGESQIVLRSCFEQIGGYDEQLVAGEDCNLFFRLQKEGKVAYLSDLEVHHSPRRFRQYGYWKVSYQYFMEGVSRLFARKSFAKEWKVVR
jgi:glycosyltransferase involved in cell wall biosynthesis